MTAALACLFFGRGALATPRLLLVSMLQCLFLPGTLCETVRFGTYEEKPPGTVIGVLAEELQQLGSPIDGAPNIFRLMKQSGNSSLVRVRERDGQLSLGAERLDREQLCGQAEEPCVMAFDVVSLGGPRGGSSSQYRLVHVELEVRDINDHAPRFPQPLIALEVSESAAPGTRLPLDLAHDLDVGSNGIQSFAVSPNSHFGLEAQSRADGLKCAELVLLTELDREAQAAYRLELVAKDGGSPARSGTATVSVRVLDANDNAPAFPHGALLTVELPEDAPPGSLLLDLDASDPDEGSNGQLLYAWGSQVPAEARQLFGLDPLSGRLSLQGAVDYELQRAYELDVQASDRGASPLAASCKVVVRLLDVNDNAPTVAISALSAGVGSGGAATQAGAEEDDASASTVAYVSEAAPAESLVALVSTSDSDAGANGQVRCSLLAAPHEPFALQRAYDASYVVLTTGALDRERVAEYNLTVVAEDLGSPPAKTVRRLTVRLADENDNTPRFAKARYEVAVLENNPPGAYLASVLASDPDLGLNGKVTYHLLQKSVNRSPVSSPLFSVEPSSGVMRALESLDFEQRLQLEVEIEACDGGTPQLCQRTQIGVTVVDQNDNPPQITFPSLVNGSADLPLPVRAPVGFLIARMAARDADEGSNAELSFSILGVKPKLFGINPLTGELFLRKRLPGDALPETPILLILAVEDGGRPSLTCTATLRLIPTDTLPSSVEIVAIQPSTAEKQPFNLALLLIAVLAGGCGLLLVAILLVVASTCRTRKSLLRGMPHQSVQAPGNLSFGRVEADSTYLDFSTTDIPGAEGSGDPLCVTERPRNNTSQMIDMQIVPPTCQSPCATASWLTGDWEPQHKGFARLMPGKAPSIGLAKLLSAGISCAIKGTRSSWVELTTHQLMSGGILPAGSQCIWKPRGEKSCRGRRTWSEERAGGQKGQGLLSFSVFPQCQLQIKAKAAILCPLTWNTHSAPDQVSMKDSGKGDSECNDSDSDTSKDRLKKDSAEKNEKQSGTAAFATDSCSGLQVHLSSRSKHLQFHFEHGGTISYPAAQRTTCVHPEFPTESKGCSPGESERLQSIYERVCSGGTTLATSSRPCKESNYTPQSSFSTHASEIATSF
ncbi:protocadherin-8-like [Rhineura floridana]|uniref:protocadherin-8-like n=1 Tax=Rhineura floridana TaxID=261503 RepID=UPI002AC87270|nr:protocadherin-8-like [Rhineura floridana]